MTFLNGRRAVISGGTGDVDNVQTRAVARLTSSKCTIYETLSSNCPYNEPVRLRTCELSFPIHHHPQSSAQYSPRMCADTLRTQDTTCQYPGCQRSVWQDPDGSYSSYCGTTHRDAMKLLNSEESVQLCKNCASRPAYIADGCVHDFCGLRCRDAFQAGKPNPGSPRASPAPTFRMCKLHGCQHPVFVGSDGVPSDYCDHAHRLEAVQSGKAEACLLCGKWPKATLNGKLSDFCSRRCTEDTLDSAPIILHISNNMAIFRAISKFFKDQWKHPTPSTPTIVKIWKIYCDRAHEAEFSKYRHAIHRKTHYPSGNSKRRWHGTIRACTIGDSEGQTDFCEDDDCSLCSIIRTSFRIAKAKRRTNFGRFGAGIYTSATSSKAHAYVAEKGGSPYKAMLLNDVVLGKPIKLKKTDTSLTEPPEDYDSVIGEPGGDLNYDEAIVYKNEAIRPLFLVIYRH